MKRLNAINRLLSGSITLSIMLGLVLGSLSLLSNAKVAAFAGGSYPLNPNDFVSLGTSPFNAAGTYTIDASKDLAAPILTKPDSTTITGVFHSPSNGAVARDEIAVFTFNSLTIPADVTVQGARTGNSRPIALLSQSTITIDGTIDVSGANGTNGTSEFDPLGGTGGNGGNAGPGGGGGAGGAGRNSSAGVGFEGGASGSSQSSGGSVVAGGGGNNGVANFSGGGGAFGGNGGNGSANVFGLGGTAYGDLTLRLHGGSGGGGGGNSITPGSCDPDDGCGPGTIHGGGGGGGGGGAVELGAVGDLTLNGNVLANGGAGGVNLSGHSGGAGAGGGIFLHATTVALSGNLNARGGNVNGSSVTNGGGGGGGRVQILTANGMLSSGSLTTNVNVSGGTGYQAGGSGVKELSPTQLAFVQQPTSVSGTSLATVTVHIQDARGNLVNTSTAPVTLALGNNPTGATLGGTLTVNAVGGIATFDNLTVSKPGTGYTLVASSGIFPNATTQSFDITCPFIQVLPGVGSLPGGVAGSNYSLQFTQRGGVGAITWTISPTIPGLSIDANGLLSGTPTQAGNYSPIVTATDGTGCPGSASYSFAIACPSIALPAISLPDGGYNTAYAATTLTPTGGTAPYQFTVTGLPSGMQAIATSTNVRLEGTPTQTGTFTVAVRVLDAYGCGNGTNGQSYPMRINKGTPVITWTNPANITYGTALSSTQLNATANVDGSFAYSPASGTVLNAGNGQSLSVGFTPTDTNNYTTASKVVQINVLKATPSITWTPPAYLLSGPLSATVLNATANTVGTFSYTPAAGTVLAPGSVTLRANFTPDSGNYNPASLSVTVPVLDNVCGITVNPTTLPAATRGTPFVQTLSAAPTGSYVFSLLSGQLPPGITLVNTLGIYSLRGTPTTAGTYQFTIKAKKNNSTCEGARTYTVVVP